LHKIVKLSYNPVCRNDLMILRRLFLPTVLHLSLPKSRTVVTGQNTELLNFCPVLDHRKMAHFKCRNNPYLHTDAGQTIKTGRLSVPDEKVDWSSSFPGYSPPDFTAPFVLTASWADPQLEDEDFSPLWNSVDGKVNRESHEGKYRVDNGKPLNPRGRTGLQGRGVLGKWGPNHAADPIVTRWKRDTNGKILTDSLSSKNVLEFVSIQRKDTGAWAIPGGMVDPGEKVSVTVKREFLEEALDSTDTGRENLEELKEMVEKFFVQGTEVYRGYVDDPRNTDNSWMETVAFNFHDSTGEEIGRFPLKAGDDAAAIQWMEVNSSLNLYASHKHFIELVVRNLGAHW